MSDILPVSLQNKLRYRKSAVRKQKQISFTQTNAAVVQAAFLIHNQEI